MISRIIMGIMAVGAVSYMLGEEPPLEMTPIEDAMATVSSIGIVMLGSLPMTELIQRIPKKPLERLGEHLGMNSVSIAGLFISFVSAAPELLGALLAAKCVGGAAGIAGGILVTRRKREEQ